MFETWWVVATTMFGDSDASPQVDQLAKDFSVVHSREALLKAHIHSFANPRHARAGVRNAVDHHQAVEADAHAAEDPAWFATDRPACLDLAPGEQHSRHRLALERLDRLAVEQ